MSEPSCVICLADLNDDLLSHTNTCSHSFHFHCIKLWAETSNSCPICRTHFTEISATATLGGPVVKRESVESRKQASSNTDFGFGDDDVTYCTVCGGSHDENVLLLCDMCDEAFHTYCVHLTSVPEGDWYCSSCKDIRQTVPELNGRSSPATNSRRQRGRRTTQTSVNARDSVPSVPRQQRDSLVNRLRNDMRRERAEEAMHRVINSMNAREAGRSGTKRNIDDINVDDTDVHDLRRNISIDRRFETRVTPASSSTPRSTAAQSGVRSSSSSHSATADVDRAWHAFDCARKTSEQKSVDAADRKKRTGQRSQFRPSSSNRHPSAGPITPVMPISSTLVSPSVRSTTNPIATTHKNLLPTLRITHPFSSRTPISTTRKTFSPTLHPRSSRTQSSSINPAASRITTAPASLSKATPSTQVPKTNSISSFPPGHTHSPMKTKQNVALPSNISFKSFEGNVSHQGTARNTEEKRNSTTRTSMVGEIDDVANSWQSYEREVRPNSRHNFLQRKQ